MYPYITEENNANDGVTHDKSLGESGNISTGCIVSEDMYQDDTSFRMTFHNGYIIRNLFDFTKKCNLKTNIRLSKNKIYFSEGNINGTILNEFKIDTCDLIEYEFNSSYTIYLLSFDSVIFCNLLRSVGTKQTLRLYKKPGINIICLQIVASYDQIIQSGSMMTPLIQSGPLINRLPPPFTLHEDTPTCKTTIERFCDDCKRMKDQKYNKVLVKGTKTGITFFANELTGTNLTSYGKSNNQKPMDFDIGSIDFNTLSINTSGKNIIVPSKQNKQNGVSIDINIIKSLMTLKNISGKAIVKFYYESIPYTQKNGVIEYAETLKILVPIGTSGILKIYIRSNE